MSELSDLYQEVILDHSRHPHNYYAMPDATRKADGYNPLCGDRVNLFLRMKGDLIEDISFEGAGCAISKSSASLLTDVVKGKTEAEARAMAERFRHLVTEGGEPLSDDDKLAVFSGVSEFPTRVKCAVLAWHTLLSALDQGQKVPEPPRPTTLRIGETTKLLRDCEVVQIPEGYRVRLSRGTDVRLLQSLGDTFTLMTEYGTMVRIDGKDADAIGMTPPAAGAAATGLSANAEELKERVWSALRGVFDPEIPVNVVDLGLIYKNEVTSIPTGYRVEVDLSLTAPGCGMGNVLKEDAERRIRALPGATDVRVQIVFDPPWNQSMMSEAAKLELGLA